MKHFCIIYKKKKKKKRGVVNQCVIVLNRSILNENNEHVNSTFKGYCPDCESMPYHLIHKEINLFGIVKVRERGDENG